MLCCHLTINRQDGKGNSFGKYPKIDFDGFLYSTIYDYSNIEHHKPYKEYCDSNSIHKKFKIFTTNYYTAIEHYFEEYLNYPHIDNGSIIDTGKPN
jgi:hypothetical protein